MMNGWRKGDPPTTKKLPAEADMPELLAKVAGAADATERQKAVEDCVCVGSGSSGRVALCSDAVPTATGDHH